MSITVCCCADPSCFANGCRRARDNDLHAPASPFHGPCPPASEKGDKDYLADMKRAWDARVERNKQEKQASDLAEMTQLRDAWKAKYEQMKKAFNAADTLCVEIGYALEGKDVPRDKDELLERVVFLRQDRDRLRSILPPERERHRGVGEGSWAVFAERMLAERDAAREEVAALRAQVAALAENGVSLHKAEEAGRQQGAADERERILAWIDRKLASPAQSVFFRGLKIGRLGIRKGIAGNEHRERDP